MGKLDLQHNDCAAPTFGQSYNDPESLAQTVRTQGPLENLGCLVVGFGVNTLVLLVGLANGLGFLGLGGLPLQAQDPALSGLLALIFTPASLFLYWTGVAVWCPKTWFRRFRPGNL